MNINVKVNCDGIDWTEAYEVIKKAGLSVSSPENTKIAFQNSYAVIFLFDNDSLIGTGRAISDGIRQAAIYDITVLPEYQGTGLGRKIIEELHKKLEGMNILLYARPGAENFYRKLGYSKMLTGMAKFNNEDSMRQRGFIE